MIRLRYPMGVGWFKIEMRKNFRRLSTLSLAGGVIACVAAPQVGLSAGGLGALPLEEAAYHRAGGGGRDYKGAYLKKLSPGGKAYFLACRRDYREALQALEKVPKHDTGSYYYVKAFCQEGLGRHTEAAKSYDLAASKIGTVFNPGFRFYLSCASAYMKIGEEKKAQKNLDTAEPASEEYGTYEAYPRFVREEIKKRKVAVVELKGRYKEAFDKYVQMFNYVNDQFHLEEPLQGDAESKKMARDWLSQQKSAPVFKSEIEEGIYLLTKGKVSLALGNIAESKDSLQKCIAVQIRNRGPKRLQYEDLSLLARVKDQARTVLIKIYYKEKNYPKCCEYIRALYRTEVFSSIDTIYNTIAMHDVAQLVTKSDLALHNKMLEFKLDKSDF